VRQVDQARLKLRSERAALLTAVRKHYYGVLTLHRKQQILSQLVDIARESVDTTRKLLEAKRVAELDLIRAELALEKARAELEATRQELPAALKRLAASVGVVDLPCPFLSGNLEVRPPEYDLEEAIRILLATHPDILSTQVGVARADLLLQRARAEVTPNVTVQAGYMYQGQNRSNDWTVGVSVPLPVWNRNEGNIQAAQARVGSAVQTVGRTQAELVEKLSEAFRTYASARERAERFRTSVLPRSRETYNLTLNAYRAGQFPYLRVLEAQNATAEVNLEYNRSLGEVWQAASEIAGLLQLE
jgi:cobalt-zinc-cadmium efflux system outer membrane protein